MKYKLLSLIFTFLILNFILATQLKSVNPIYAQEEITSAISGSVIISPPFQPLTVGNSYDLLIQNNSEEEINVIVSESLFNYSNEKEQLTKVSSDINTDTNYLNYSETNFKIPAKSTFTLNIEKLSEPENLYAGTLVTIGDSSGTKIGAQIELASVTYNNLFSSNDLRQVDINYELITSGELPGNITFNPEFIYKININNNSNKFISTSGEVISRTKNQNLVSKEFTSKLGRFLLPNSTKNIDTEITITNYPQNFWQFVMPQKIEFNAMITYDLAISIQTDSEFAWYIHPLAILFWLVITVVIITLLFFGLKRFTSHKRIS